jgi:hypothetical protein
MVNTEEFIQQVFNTQDKLSRWEGDIILNLFGNYPPEDYLLIASLIKSSGIDYEIRAENQSKNANFNIIYFNFPDSIIYKKQLINISFKEDFSINTVNWLINIDDLPTEEDIEIYALSSLGVLSANKIDYDFLKLLYDPCLKVGMTKEKVRSKLNGEI